MKTNSFISTVSLIWIKGSEWLFRGSRIRKIVNLENSSNRKYLSSFLFDIQFSIVIVQKKCENNVQRSYGLHFWFSISNIFYWSISVENFTILKNNLFNRRSFLFQFEIQQTEMYFFLYRAPLPNDVKLFALEPHISLINSGEPQKWFFDFNSKTWRKIGKKKNKKTYGSYTLKKIVFIPSDIIFFYW